MDSCLSKVAKVKFICVLSSMYFSPVFLFGDGDLVFSKGLWRRLNVQTPKGIDYKAAHGLLSAEVSGSEWTQRLKGKRLMKASTWDLLM